MRVDVVAFYVSMGDPELHAKYMVYLDLARRSVEQQPDHRFTVLTNQVTKLPPGVRRSNLALNECPLMLNELWAQHEYWKINHENPVVFTAFDCLINRDIREVFRDADWDIGVTYRSKANQPINNVLYVNNRNPMAALAFLRKSHEILAGLDPEWHDWFGDQEAIWIAMDRIRGWEDGRDTILIDDTSIVKYLPCSTYNWFPKGKKLLSKARPAEPYVIHFKGERKAYMKKFWEAHN